MNDIPEADSVRSCGMIRRLAAIFYDSLLLFAVLFVATAILMPFTHGNAIHSENPLYFIYLTGWAYLFFSWQWTHGGQTLGMRAWKLSLFDTGNGPVGWKIASKRFFLAMLSWLFFGAGFIWALFDREKLTFHDRYSNTRLYRVNN